MPQEKKLKVELLRHTLNPEEMVALGAKLCYSKSTIDDLREKVEAKDQSTFVNRLLSMGHESVFEHASFTFGIEGVSRVLLAQLTRHRLASFSVQSQRYVSYENVYHPCEDCCIGRRGCFQISGADGNHAAMVCGVAAIAWLG